MKRSQSHLLVQLRAENARFRRALEDVVDPLGHLKRHAEASGGRLNDRAYGIANSQTYIQSIAQDALAGRKSR